MERDRTEWTIPRLEKGNDYFFQVAAFSLVDGEHYMIGPRSPAAKAGKGGYETLCVACRKKYLLRLSIVPLKTHTSIHLAFVSV